MFHTVILVGNLGRDPEMHYTPSGQAVTNFSVAVSDGFGDRKTTMWFRIATWGKQAETSNQYLKKGSKVLIEGRLICDPATGSPKIWTGQKGPGTSFEVNAGVVKFLSSRGENGEPLPDAVGDPNAEPNVDEHYGDGDGVTF